MMTKPVGTRFHYCGTE